jgi:L-asparagine transporter-like permease
LDVLVLFFSTYHLAYLALFLAICIIIGGLGIASSWMIGMARGLHVSLCAMKAPVWIQKLNKNDMPARVLLIQAILYTVLLCAFLLFPDITSSYWILSAITAQFALFYYILLFCAAIKLLKKDAKSLRQKVLSTFLPGMAAILCFLGILAGFVPPEFVHNKKEYIFLLLIGFVLLGCLPIFLVGFMNRVNKEKT